MKGCVGQELAGSRSQKDFIGFLANVAAEDGFAGETDTSWPGNPARRTALLRSPMSRSSTSCLLNDCKKDVDARVRGHDACYGVAPITRMAAGPRVLVSRRSISSKMASRRPAQSVRL